MAEQFKNIAIDNIDKEHLCCAIADTKHQLGVQEKKRWLKDRLNEGHVFRKLDAKAKVFIEYSPIESVWTPVMGDNYIYIYCLWVAGSFKSKGYAKSLLEYCIDDAKKQGKSGICVLSAKKKKPFLTDKGFMTKFGFKVVDSVGDYELLALAFDGMAPTFSDSVKKSVIESKNLTIYYSVQCPYTLNCIEQVENFCKNNDIFLDVIAVDSLAKAKNVPCIFNNWAVFLNGQFQTVHLLNEGHLKKLLNM